MFANPAVPALMKICLAFALMLFAIRRKCELWIAVLLGGVLLALLFGLSPLVVGTTMAGAFADPSFLTLFSIVACIMVLSELQGATGQGRRLVDALTPYMKSPRLRLMFFPALIGLLPMPGGAVFSCPMVRDVAASLDLPDERKALINYWFRHIWESAWPLYPGYILTCAIADIPPSVLWRHTFPAVLISLAVGWVILLRRPIRRLSEEEAAELPPKGPFSAVLLEGLPIFVAILGAPIYEALFSLVDFKPPNGVAFICSFITAIAAVMTRNNVSPAAALKLLMQKRVFRMLSLIVAIFMFKELVMAAKVVDALAGVMTGKSALLFLFVFLPAVMGMLTGLMLGFVGAAFPLLLALLAQTGAYDERLSWILVALFAGHCGQMISPLHGCYLLTVEYFRVPLSATWRTAFFAATSQLTLSLAYVAVLYTFIHPTL